MNDGGWHAEGPETGAPVFEDGHVLTAAHFDEVLDYMDRRVRQLSLAHGPGWVRSPDEAGVNGIRSVELESVDQRTGVLRLRLTNLHAIGKRGTQFKLAGPISTEVSLEGGAVSPMLLHLSVRNELDLENDRPTTRPIVPRLVPHVTAHVPRDADSVCIGRIVSENGAARLDGRFLGRASSIHATEAFSQRATALIERMVELDARVFTEIKNQRKEGQHGTDPLLIVLSNAWGSGGDQLSTFAGAPLDFAGRLWRALRRFDRVLATIVMQEELLDHECPSQAGRLEHDCGPVFDDLERALHLIEERFSTAVGAFRRRGLVIQSMELNRIDGVLGPWHRISVRLGEPLGNALGAQGRTRLKLTFPSRPGPRQARAIEARFSSSASSYPGRTTRRARIAPDAGFYTLEFAPAESERASSVFELFVQGDVPFDRAEDLLIEATP